eukprot:Hpha_TRINITY_DN3838_c0_g1::TRINITY_DN3838_c0_g1_i1::g.44483::m.44483
MEGDAVAAGQMPADVLVRVAGYLRVPERLNGGGLVSWQWHRGFVASIIGVTAADEVAPGREQAFFRQCFAVREIKYPAGGRKTRAEYAEDIVRMLRAVVSTGRAEQITSAKLGGYEPNEEGWALLRELTGLRSLELYSNADRVVDAMPGLTSFSTGCVSAALLSSLRGLENLHLAHATGATARSIGSLRQLRSLDMVGCDSLSATVISDMAGALSGMENCNLSQTAVTSAALERLAKSSPGLAALNLRGCTQLTEDSDDDFFPDEDSDGSASHPPPPPPPAREGSAWRAGGGGG